MRITKEPEVRKQEILDTAIKVFTKKGYDKTSISDIAKAMNISQGLCYRYFKSKEEIYDAAIASYADFLMNRTLNSFDYNNMTLKEQIDMMSGRTQKYEQVEHEKPEMYKLFHKVKNSQIHDRLYLAIAENLVKVITPLVQKAIDSGEIKITDAETASYFFVYGQIGVLRRTDISDEEKSESIRRILKEFLGLN